MDDRISLMAAIVANPDEDMPRLAFADWLQEHGDGHDRARAEHIRVQIDATRHEFESAAWKRTMAKAVTIQRAHGAVWLGPLLKLGSVKLESAHAFRRGLLFWWYTPTKTFLQKSHQVAVCEWLPRVGADCIILNDRATREPEVAASPALEWVPRFLWSDSKVNDSGLAALAASPHFGRLSSFRLNKCKLTDDGLSAFAASAAMPNLKHFGLTETRRLGTYTAAGILAVVNSPRFPKLCDLELDSHQTTTLDYGRLFADARLGKLTRLRLGWASDVTAVVCCPHLKKLEELSVSSSTITDADADELLANPALVNLTRVRMLGMNAGKARLSPSADQRLRDRFGESLRLEYS